MTREFIKNEKKTRILEAAALLFSRKQYHEVMIEDVAKLASIAKGTVYNYFSSKEELYFSIMLERMDKLINSLTQQIKTNQDSRSALKSFVLHVYMFMMKYSEFFLMYRKETLQAENQLCGTISTMQNQLRSMLIDIIKEGIQNKIFRELREGFAADLILGSIYAAVDRGLKNNFDENDLINERGETFSFIFEGMCAHAGMLPLKNKIIVLTRTEEQNRETAHLFEAEGASVVSFPALKVCPADNNTALDLALDADPEYVVFMSVNAVKIFSEKLKKLDRKLVTGKNKIVALGPRTAEQCVLSELTPDIIPQKNSAEGLAEYFRKMDIEGQKFLIPRSAAGRDEFIDFLKDKKADPLVVDMYTISAPLADEIKEHREKLSGSHADLIVFASPSAFNNFLDLLSGEAEEFLRHSAVAAIGPTTSDAIISKGFKVDIQPLQYTMNALRDAIIEFYKKEKQ